MIYLYTRYDSVSDTLTDVFYNSTTGEITYNARPAAGETAPDYADGDIITSTCQDTTQLIFKAQSTTPYAYYDTIFNSTACGYVPATCDLQFSGLATVTNESGAGLNDGKISVFATSSYLITNYKLISGTTPLQINTTGLFEGLLPGEYEIEVTDSNGCYQQTTAKVKEYNPNPYNFKYKVEFSDIENHFLNRIEFYDKKNEYNPEVYPISLTGGGSPLSYKIALQSEDKSEPIAASSIVVRINTSQLFTVEEFSLADERTWFVKWYQGDKLRLQGWLLPDQIEDLYDDLGYAVEFTITDGLLSLSGYDFGNESGEQQFGIKSWLHMVKWCLDKLNYEYEGIVIIKSLQYNGNMDWLQVGTWADLFYDQDGVAISAIDALRKLLTGFKMTIFQQGSKFYLVDFNVLSYTGNDVVAERYNLCFFEYDSELNPIANGTGVQKPERRYIGSKSEIEPINGPQSLNFDLAFSQLIADVKFDLLVLLYNNPSFEFGSVDGALSPGMVVHGSGVPGSGLTKADSYIGDWSFKVGSNGLAKDAFIEIGPFPVDQDSKVLNLSFNWKVPYSGEQIGLVASVVPTFVSAGNGYYLQQSPYRAIAVQDTGAPFYDNSNHVVWEVLQPTEYHSEGDAVSIKTETTTDHIGWQSFSLTSPPFPGKGDLYFRFYSVKGLSYDGTYPGFGTGNDKLYFALDSDPSYYYLIDNLVLTISDANDQYNKQVGETHTVTNLTNYATAEKKTLSIDLFNYGGNKRIAGNVFYGLDYITAQVANLWSDTMKLPLLQDRLPAIIIRQLARSYQRPMSIFEGSVEVDFINFLTLFVLKYYESKKFIPFSIDLDVLNRTADITICETDDRDFQSSYTYVAKFEKSAKKVVN